MNIKVLFVVIIICIKLNFLKSQTFFTSDNNQFDAYTYTQLWLKAAAGYSFIIVDGKIANGFNWNIGTLVDYYIYPKVAMRIGAEFESKNGYYSKTESTSLNTNTITTFDISYSCFKLPLGFVFDDTKRGKGYMFGFSIIPVLGLGGSLKYSINQNNIIDRSAYAYDTTKYQTVFNRLGLMSSFFISYKFNKDFTAGVEYSTSMLNIYNSSQSSIYPNQISLYLLLNLIKN